MELNVLYGCDENYAPYTGVSITSLLENNKHLDVIRIYVAAQGFSEQSRERMTLLAGQYGREIIFLNTEKAEAQIQNYHCKGWNGSLATWLRFFVLEQLPDSIDRVLWLDSDTIVCGDLSKLCAFDFEGAPIACVCDSICYYERFRLGFGYAEPYFNAGVISFNLQYWRENNTLDQMFSHLKDHVSKYRLNDQDLLNDFFRGNIKKLDPIYNCQGTLQAYAKKGYWKVYPWKEEAFYLPETALYAVDHPVVIHFFRFLGDYPWQQGRNYHPDRELYNTWKQRSPWKDHCGMPPRKEMLFKIEKLLYVMLPKQIFLRIFSFVTNRELPKCPTT